MGNHNCCATSSNSSVDVADWIDDALDNILFFAFLLMVTIHLSGVVVDVFGILLAAIADTTDTSRVVNKQATDRLLQTTATPNRILQLLCLRINFIFIVSIGLASKAVCFFVMFSLSISSWMEATHQFFQWSARRREFGLAAFEQSHSGMKRSTPAEQPLGEPGYDVCTPSPIAPIHQHNRKPEADVCFEE